MLISRRPLAFLDTETTGLNPITHEIIDIAIIREDSAGLIREWSTRIRPQNLEKADPKALAINGYRDHPEKWNEAPTFQEVAPIILQYLKDALVVGHNVKFDQAMLQGNLKRHGIFGRLDYHNLDTTTLAYEHLVPCGLESLSLDNIRKFLAWSSEDAHTALQDARDTRRLYHMLNRASIWDHLKWKLWGFRDAKPA